MAHPTESESNALWVWLEACHWIFSGVEPWTAKFKAAVPDLHEQQRPRRRLDLHHRRLRRRRRRDQLLEGERHRQLQSHADARLHRLLAAANDAADSDGLGGLGRLLQEGQVEEVQLARDFVQMFSSKMYSFDRMTQGLNTRETCSLRTQDQNYPPI